MVIMENTFIASEFNIFQKKLKNIYIYNKKLKNIYIYNKNIITNIYRMEGYISVTCGCFCTGFITFMLKRKSFLNYINIFFSNEYKNNDKIIKTYFQ